MENPVAVCILMGLLAGLVAWLQITHRRAMKRRAKLPEVIRKELEDADARWQQTYGP